MQKIICITRIPLKYESSKQIVRKMTVDPKIRRLVNHAVAFELDYKKREELFRSAALIDPAS